MQEKCDDTHFAGKEFLKTKTFFVKEFVYDSYDFKKVCFSYGSFSYAFHTVCFCQFHQKSSSTLIYLIDVIENHLRTEMPYGFHQHVGTPRLSGTLWALWGSLCVSLGIPGTL